MYDNIVEILQSSHNKQSIAEHWWWNVAVQEIYAHLLTNASAFWAGWVENCPGRVEFCIEHTSNICFQASAPKI